MIEPLHTLSETAKILGISTKTLMIQVRLGNIRCNCPGDGKKRVHRRFSDKNIQTYLEKTKVKEVAPCPSSNTVEAPIGKLSFKSTVVPFGAVPKPATGKKHLP